MTPSMIDIDHSLTFSYQLAANQTAVGLQQPISAEGDFYLCGVQATCVEYQRPDLIQLAANAAIRLSDDTGYKFSSNYLPLRFFSPQYGNPFPFVIRPAHFFKSGTRINIDIQELSGVPSVMQIIFRGRMRYKTAALAALRQSVFSR